MADVYERLTQASCTSLSVPALLSIRRERPSGDLLILLLTVLTRGQTDPLIVSLKCCHESSQDIKTYVAFTAS